MAFRPGSDAGDVTPDPSVDVSAWEETSILQPGSDIINDLDKPIDLDGHILSPFYPREIIYQNLHGQHSNPMHSETDHSRMNSYHPYIFQTNEERNKKSDLKYEVSPTVLPPGRPRVTKKTVATGLAHHISEVIKLSLAFKTQLIFLRPDTPNHRNSIGSSLRLNDYVQCRRCSNFERDRPNLGSESPTSTVPMKLYHGSATCDTVNTPGLSKSSECRRPSNLMDYTECLERISSAAQLGKWQSTDYSTIIMGDSIPTQHPEDCHPRTQGLNSILGDHRPPGQPPDHYYKWTSQFLDFN